MTQPPESVYPASVDHTEFRAALAATGLTQADLARLLKDGPITVADRVTVSCWARGLRPVPDAVALFFKTWQMVAKSKRNALLASARLARKS